MLSICMATKHRCFIPFSSFVHHIGFRSSLIFCPSKAHNRCIISFQKTQIFRPQHRKDRVPKEFTLVYENSLRNVVGPSRVASTIGGLLSAGLVFEYIYTNVLEPGTLYFMTGVGLLALFLVAFVNVMSRYYLLRIYYSEDTKRFIGVYRTFMGRAKHVPYSMTDLQPVQPQRKDFPLHKKSNVQIKGRTFHLRVNDFVLPKYYNMHLGL